MDDLRELYQEVILDHGKAPRNYRRPEDANRQAAGRNPLCGDQLEIYIRLDGDDRIADAAFLGKGCAISVASASMMTEIVKGKSRAEAETMFGRFRGMCTGEAAEGPAADDEDMERLRVMSGVRQFPVRVKCATLAWHALDAALSGKGEATTER